MPRASFTFHWLLPTALTTVAIVCAGRPQLSAQEALRGEPTQVHPTQTAGRTGSIGAEPRHPLDPLEPRRDPPGGRDRPSRAEPTNECSLRHRHAARAGQAHGRRAPPRTKPRLARFS